MSREILEILLAKGTDSTINALMSNPNLQYLYPYQGLQWVTYLGRGIARLALKPGAGKISFDPQKIQDVRYQEPLVKEPLVKEQEPDVSLLAVGKAEQQFVADATKAMARHVDEVVLGSKGKPLTKGLL